MQRHFEKMTFTGSTGDRLAARLDVPATEPRATALFAHCFTCGKDIAAASRIAAGLVAEGYAVLRFDFTGLGSSEGEFANTDFTSNVDDIVAAAGALADRLAAPALLVGHSLGGAAVLSAAGALGSVRAVATIGAPSDPAHIEHLFRPEELQRIQVQGEADVSLAGRRFRIGRRLLDDISAQRLDEAVESLGAALLVMHSPVDELVGIDHARRLYEAARHPKSFVSLDDADHLLTDRVDAAYVARVLAAWASRYVPQPGDETTGSEPAPGEVVVRPAGTGRFTQHVHAGRHTLLADEPVGVGDDAGPNPYDLLLAALGACTSMTLRMYADRAGIALDDVVVRLRHERVHVEDCGHADDGPCQISRIERQIRLVGDLDDQQRTRLARIADRCPVHRTLEGHIEVSSDVAVVSPAPRDG